MAHAIDGTRKQGLVEFIDERLTPPQWLEKADAFSRAALGVDAQVAWTRVCNGEFEGTPFASELWQLMFLAGEDHPLPKAAE